MQRTDTNDLDKIIKIQSIIRSTQIRDRFEITQLSDNDLVDYSTFVVGNDPIMPRELDNFAEPNDKIALVATSGMRAVSLACKLGNPNQLPKIILVDNSQQVTAFWQAMRLFMQDDATSGTKELFLSNLPNFLNTNIHLYRDIEAKAFKDDCTPTLKYLSQDINGYFSGLIKKYGYDYVRSVILHTSVIKQSWADSDTFIKIKNIVGYLGINNIFMYPSNIVACINDRNIQDQILSNIASVSPTLSIHTDVCDRHGHPEKVLLITNQDPRTVKSTLFQTTCQNPSKNTEQTSISLNQLIYLLASMQNKNTNEYLFVK